MNGGSHLNYEKRCTRDMFEHFPIQGLQGDTVGQFTAQEIGN